MNSFKKVYCRIYQGAFYLAMPLMPYRKPKLIESIKALPDVLLGAGINSVLLVTDSFLRSSGATADLESVLKERGVKCTVFDETRPNPTEINVEDAVKKYISGACKGLIAFGGGSSMDCAKAVGARIAYPKKNLDRLKGLLRVLKSIPPLVAIPTTAGTGSEVTVTAVITDSARNHKYTMNDFTLIPHYAVLDPAVTATLPPSLTATTGMDALCHAVEAYIGRSTTKETRKLAVEAVKLIFENIEKAYTDGSDLNARSNMLHASHIAGIAFSKSYVGYIHAVAHSLGGQYNVPHGLANAVIMPIVLEDYGVAVYKKLKKLSIAAGVAPETDDEKTAAEKFIAAIRSLNKKMGIPSTISGIKTEDISLMAKHADKEANPLYPVPVLMNAAELEKFYCKVGNIERATI